MLDEAIQKEIIQKGRDFLKSPLERDPYEEAFESDRERVCQDDFCKFSKFKYLSAEKTPNISCRHIS